MTQRCVVFSLISGVTALTIDIPGGINAMGLIRAHLLASVLMFFGLCSVGTEVRAQLTNPIDLSAIVHHPSKALSIKMASFSEVHDKGYGKMGNLDLNYQRILQDEKQGQDDGKGGSGLDLWKIVNIGKEIWKIITDNRPVANIITDSASAVPYGTRDWTDLQGWKMPESKVYRVTYKNGFGSTVVDFSFRVMYTHGGNVHGVGHYLSNVTIVPANLNVSWGYRFSAEGTTPNIMNVGTHEDPIAGIQLMLVWSVDTVTQHSEKSAAFFVRGDGGLFDLSSPK